MDDFTPEQRARFEKGVAELLERYPADQKGAALLMALHLAQDIVGWVPRWVMREVARAVEVPEVRVRECATFYTMYHLEKPGRHLIEVCTNPSCQVRGADEIVRKVRERFGVEPGHTSADGKVTLEIAECLGSCGTAPMVAIDREYREDITRSKLEKLFEELEG